MHWAAARLRLGPRSLAETACAALAVVLACSIADRAEAQSSAQPLKETATAGALAALPARGLAAAIAEAGRIEVPTVDPRQPVTITATQASRWTEGSYDVWHLTGGVRIRQAGTEATAHEAVVWIEQEAEALADSGEGGDETPPPVRSMLVRMAGDVSVRSGTEEANATATTVRGPRWTGRFWLRDDPKFDFASIVPAAGTPPIYDAPADRVVPEIAPIDASAEEPIQQAQFSDCGAAPVPAVNTTVPARRLRAFPRSNAPLNIRWFPSPAGNEWVAVITSGVNLVVDGVDPARHSPTSTATPHRPATCRWNSTWRATSSSGRGSGSSRPSACSTTCRGPAV